MVFLGNHYKIIMDGFKHVVTDGGSSECNLTESLKDVKVIIQYINNPSFFFIATGEDINHLNIK